MVVGAEVGFLLHGRLWAVGARAGERAWLISMSTEPEDIAIGIWKERAIKAEQHLLNIGWLLSGEINEETLGHLKAYVDRSLS